MRAVEMFDELRSVDALVHRALQALLLMLCYF